MTPSRLFQNKYVHRALTLVFLLTMTLTTSAQWPAQQDEGGIPAYNAGSAAQGHQTPSHPHQGRSLGSGRAVPLPDPCLRAGGEDSRTVLHQQPCYCYCDRMGHNSLHSCYENTHGAQCATCLKELYYSYQQHQRGKTASQIRAAIIRGDWKLIDLQSAATLN